MRRAAKTSKTAKPAKAVRTRKAAKQTFAPSPATPPSGYWLLKSEPDAFSWDMLVAKGKKGEPWTGVRSFQARNNMRAMQIGDLGFFYHSNIGKQVVGICEVIALAHQDATDETGAWQCVDVKAVTPFPKPVTLEDIKVSEKLAAMVLVNNSRLSVQPVNRAEWDEVCRMGGFLR